MAVAPDQEIETVVEMARMAKTAGAAVISVTAFSVNRLQALADHKLFFRLENTATELRGTMIRFALTDVFDTLFLQFATQTEKHREALIHVDGQVSE